MLGHCERSDVDHLADLLWVHGVERLAIEHLVKVLSVLCIAESGSEPCIDLGASREPYADA